MISVEELYNKCHSPKTGKFCGGTSSKGTYATGTTYSGKAPIPGRADRAGNKAFKQARVNKDDGLPTPKVRVSGDKRADAIAITKLDRGSAERKRAAAAFEEKYGAPKARSGGVTGGPTATPKAPKRNKDDGQVTPTVKITGDKRKDALAILRLDRGSPERKRASAAYDKRYGK
jgi:hypothetical protein